MSTPRTAHCGPGRSMAKQGEALKRLINFEDTNIIWKHMWIIFEYIYIYVNIRVYSCIYQYCLLIDSTTEIFKSSRIFDRAQVTIPILSTSKRCKGLKIKSQTICTDSSGYVFTPLSAMSSFGLKKLLCSGFKELDTEKSRTSSVAVACVQQVWSHWKIKRYEWRPRKYSMYIIYYYTYYFMGLTSEVLRKMRVQPMDDHRRDVVEICRNRGTQAKFGISSSVGISRTMLCWGSTLALPRAHFRGCKKGPVQVLWQEPPNQQPFYVRTLEPQS